MGGILTDFANADISELKSYDDSNRHDVITSAFKIFDKKIKDGEYGVCFSTGPPGYKVVERQKQK